MCTYSLNLTGVDLHNSDPRGNEFFAESIGEATHGGFGGTVDAPSGIRLPTGNAAYVDDVAAAAFGSAGFENGEDGLGHVYQACHVGVEHYGDVFFCDVGRLGDCFVLPISWVLS